jgi:hypothetical protein
MHIVGHITRPLAVLAAATVLAGLTSAPTNAAPALDPQPAKAGSGWLSDQVTKGLVHNEQFDFDDVGLSIDVALGLDAAGKKPTVVKAITKAVAKNVGSYTAFPPSVYAGATAKAAVLALEQGKNPRAFGGVDLVTQLEGRVATAAPISGRIEDAYDPSDPFGGDFANVIGQAYAASALSQAKSQKAALAASFLIQQQCAKGYFRQSFTADKSRADQSCQGAPAAERGSSTDATALAVLALQDVKGAKAKASIKKAVAWLEDTQRTDGTFTDTGKSKGIVNTNSTGLAGWALGEAGATGPAGRAAAAVRAQQVVDNPCAGRLSKETGAIAYDFAAYTGGQQSGIRKKDSDQWRRASSQALPVLRWAPRGEGDFTVTAPKTVAVGKQWTIRLTGVAAGERVCGRTSNGGFQQGFEQWPGRNPITRSKLEFEHAGVRTYTIWVGTKHRDVTVRVTN